MIERLALNLQALLKSKKSVALLGGGRERDPGNCGHIKCA